VARTLLLCGAIAGPFYIVVAGAQIALRDGFDLTRHPVSLLSNGEWGWVQIANFVITGLLVIAAAVGLRQVSGNWIASRWGPILIGVFGAGLIASGVFVAAAMDGFPPGTPAGDPETVTFAGIMHFMAGGVAFLSLIAACVVYARFFARAGQSSWAMFSLATGIIYFVSFGLVAATAGSSFANLALTFAVVLGWIWLTGIALQAAQSVMDSRPAAARYG
jgi:hypothetical protein